MKRKLNEDQVPTPVAPVAATHTQQKSNAFSTLGLDSRLLQAIAKEGFSSPTPVQTKAIPLSLEGRDILGGFSALTWEDEELTRIARAKTGSGKTAAYVLPVLEAILRRKTVRLASDYPTIRADKVSDYIRQQTNYGPDPCANTRTCTASHQSHYIFLLILR